jgi:hypothetical protein
LDIVRIAGSVPPAWSVRANLWTKEEGRSDLTLELTIRQVENSYEVELDDLHVL